jgi:signal recognition particle subunit SEC65
MTTSWKVGQWTDSELKRAVDEHRATLKDLALESPARADIQRALDDLIVEQEARRRLRHPRSLPTGLSA